MGSRIVEYQNRCSSFTFVPNHFSAEAASTVAATGRPAKPGQKMTRI
jgi:hypothetical protein